MFVYDFGIIDFYSGMVLLHDYINYFCYEENDELIMMGYSYLSSKQLKFFLIKCFMEIKSRKSCWEGDIRGLHEIAIGGIPRPTARQPFKILAFKQDNNGSSFVVSECELNLDWYTLDDLKPEYIFDTLKCDKHVLFKFFEESYLLTERLFADAKKYSPYKKQIVVSNENNNLPVPIENNSQDDKNEFEQIG